MRVDSRADNQVNTVRAPRSTVVSERRVRRMKSRRDAAARDGAIDPRSGRTRACAVLPICKPLSNRRTPVARQLVVTPNAAKKLWTGSCNRNASGRLLVMLV
jgi:hypothetical protein